MSKCTPYNHNSLIDNIISDDGPLWFLEKRIKFQYFLMRGLASLDDSMYFRNVSAMLAREFVKLNLT